ncbi:putative membrane protein YphA (DoxX/SURF4 family) [Oikeobacillus pervagus]|uniref:Membrane protein YphA (DoxX/SURF4 family) n=1 Tax=Oikeobacillus pervagus TaxID=1325931 RepID=A0AAJ1WHV2_9BACI|nr:DoxX family protein [Oikeobacillus pervagus]MDQ0214005.1 putative membrane protein YphA (DoxX/SURF4 family) [Oikeobacillus pervagus]
MKKYEIGTFILRVFLGISFFIHGFVKFQGGIENIVGWFESIGLPGGIAYGIALLELVGGIALVLGLGSRFVSALFALVMIGAILKVKLAAGFLGNGQMSGYELDLAFLVMAISIMISDSRLFALDQILFKSKSSEVSKEKTA